MSTLALDYGAVRTGVAISFDGDWVFERDAIVEPDARRLASVIREIAVAESVDTIVLGLPLSMKGERTSQTDETQQFSDLLRRTLPDIDVVLWDERMTSQHAASLSREGGRTGTHHDSLAAKVLLEQYLVSRS